VGTHLIQLGTKVPALISGLVRRVFIALIPIGATALVSL